MGENPFGHLSDHNNTIQVEYVFGAIKRIQYETKIAHDHEEQLSYDIMMMQESARYSTVNTFYSIFLLSPSIKVQLQAAKK